MEIPNYSAGKTGRVEVDPSFLGDKVKTKTLRAAIIMYEANQRVGTHDTKTRAEIARSKKQLFPQKGTGRARVRHPQVSQCRGGGRAHGPKPRDYSYSMPRKELKVALRAALLSKFKDGQVAMIDGLKMAAPKTKELSSVLESLGCQGSCLIVTDAVDKNLLLSARNLPRVKVIPATGLNAFDVVYHRHLLVTQAGFKSMKEVHGHA